MAGRRGKKKPDIYEDCARARLEPFFDELRDIDPGGGPKPLHDFEGDLPGGGVAVIEVTSTAEREERELESAVARRFPCLTVSGSGYRWLVAPSPDAQMNAISSGDLRLLLHGMERDGRRSVHCRGDWRDPFVQRLRELRIESVYAWESGAGGGTVTMVPRVYGGWGWDGAATSAWLGGFLTSGHGPNKLRKLGAAAGAAERHLVIVLDPRSPAGLCIPVGLTGLSEPGVAEAALPEFVPPEPLTHLWLVPMLEGWLGLGWERGSGWSVLEA